MAFVYSTMSTDCDYTFYAKVASDLPVVERAIRIKGGANIASPTLVTPHGVVTKVTDEELSQLIVHPVFKMHQENGFISVRSSNPDPEVVAADMEQRDRSSPMTPNDYPEKDEVSGLDVQPVTFVSAGGKPGKPGKPGKKSGKK